jgi:hypothetical protein
LSGQKKGLILSTTEGEGYEHTQISSRRASPALRVRGLGATSSENTRNVLDNQTHFVAKERLEEMFNNLAGKN